MKRLVLVSALLLAGCKTAEPAVEVRTVSVPVLRIEKCVATADIPKVPTELGKRPTHISAALDILFAKYLEMRTYAAKADAVMKGCASG